MTHPPEMTLADYVRELTEPHDHREHYTFSPKIGATTYGRDHVTKAPPLIVQLLLGDVPSGAAEEGPRAGFGSKPAARLDAIDEAIRIDLKAARWVRDLGEDDPGDSLEVVSRQPPPPGPACVTCHHPTCIRIRLGEIIERRPIPGSGTIACVKLLHGLSASAYRCRSSKAKRDKETRKIICCTWHQIDADVRSWWTQARIVTGWDAAPWSPDATCPMCGERGSLKIRLVERIGMCTKCRETWEPGNIGLLADHIRAESSAERRPKEGRGPCWCPWPKPIVPDLSRLCPVCGSARCWHALELDQRHAGPASVA